MRTRTVTPASQWEPPTSNPTLRTVVGTMAAPLRLAVAFANMCLTVYIMINYHLTPGRPSRPEV
eukprot:650782-Prymnesium_polylepis.1